jgi:hypothetical protein
MQIVSESGHGFKQKRHGPDDRARRWMRFAGVAGLHGPEADRWLLRLLANFEGARLAAVPHLRPHLAALVAAAAGEPKRGAR